jgi:hypothetical protein
MMQIENWSITGNPDVYDAPECRRVRLKGNVFGHPLHSEGKFVCTSDIRQVRGSEVTTNSGSVYILGTPCKEYVDFCRAEGCHIPTPEEPIKMI